MIIFLPDMILIGSRVCFPPQHKLAGKSYDQKILVLNTAKGGVASAWMLYEMAARGITPKGILFNEAEYNSRTRRRIG